MHKLEKDLEKFLNLYENSGIELTHNLKDFSGVIADIVYNPETNICAFKLLAPIEAMVQDRTHFINVKQYIYQKDKKRLTISSEGDVMYILRPVETDSGVFVISKFQLSKEDKDLLHYSLQLSTN